MDSSKKRYICDACIQMDKADTVAVLNFLYNSTQSTSIMSQNKDGIKVDLNKLPASVINGLYELVKYKINKPI